MGMYRAGIQIDVKVSRDELLTTLRKNRNEHKENFLAARDGYCEKAARMVEKKLAALKEGRPVALAFSFSPPQDMTSVYDTTINMLEWSQDDVIELNASEFRKLVEDEWDWTESWFASNSQYSEVVAASGSAKGYR